MAMNKMFILVIYKVENNKQIGLESLYGPFETKDMANYFRESLNINSHWDIWEMFKPKITVEAKQAALQDYKLDC